MDESALTEEEYNELLRWEGEGGNTTDPGEMGLTVNPPIETGQVFEVVKGNTTFDDGVLYYLAEIEIRKDE